MPHNQKFRNTAEYLPPAKDTYSLALDDKANRVAKARPAFRIR
jgi:hypothetical protein